MSKEKELWEVNYEVITDDDIHKIGKEWEKLHNESYRYEDILIKGVFFEYLKEEHKIIRFYDKWCRFYD